MHNVLSKSFADPQVYPKLTSFFSYANSVGLIILCEFQVVLLGLHVAFSLLCFAYCKVDKIKKNTGTKFTISLEKEEQNCN